MHETAIHYGKHGNHGNCFMIVYAGGPGPFDMTAEGTRTQAEFVVTACNAHDALLAACKAALPALESSYPPPVHDGPCTPESGCDAGCMELAAVERVVWKLKSAIAKAERGSP